MERLQKVFEWVFVNDIAWMFTLGLFVVLIMYMFAMGKVLRFIEKNEEEMEEYYNHKRLINKYENKSYDEAIDDLEWELHLLRKEEERNQSGS